MDGKELVAAEGGVADLSDDMIYTLKFKYIKFKQNVLIECTTCTHIMKY